MDNIAALKMELKSKIDILKCILKWLANDFGHTIKDTCHAKNEMTDPKLHEDNSNTDRKEEILRITWAWMTLNAG